MNDTSGPLPPPEESLRYRDSLWSPPPLSLSPPTKLSDNMPNQRKFAAFVTDRVAVQSARLRFPLSSLFFFFLCAELKAKLKEICGTRGPGTEYFPGSQPPIRFPLPFLFLYDAGMSADEKKGSSLLK